MVEHRRCRRWLSYLADNPCEEYFIFSWVCIDSWSLRLSWKCQAEKLLRLLLVRPCSVVVVEVIQRPMRSNHVRLGADCSVASDFVAVMLGSWWAGLEFGTINLEAACARAVLAILRCALIRNRIPLGGVNYPIRFAAHPTVDWESGRELLRLLLLVFCLLGVSPWVIDLLIIFVFINRADVIVLALEVIRF